MIISSSLNFKAVDSEEHGQIVIPQLIAEASAIFNHGGEVL